MFLQKKFDVKIFRRWSHPTKIFEHENFYYEYLHKNFPIYESNLLTVNTTAYHSQCDGLVENFNRTLHTMLVMDVKEFWSILGCSQQVLFAYQARPPSTGESLFYTVYGCGPNLPTKTALSIRLMRMIID